MEPRITRVIPLYPKTHFVQWTLDDPDNQVASFSLLRSGSPEGPFDTVVSGLMPSTFFFSDDSLVMSGLTSKVWYVVQAVPLTGAINSVLSLPFSVSSNKYEAKNKILRKARRDLKITLSKLSGVRIVVLKRKRFGDRCTSCFNPVTKDVVTSRCSLCYGTGYEGGYHHGYPTWGKVDPPSVQEIFDRSGASEVSLFGITMPDCPLVELDDVIVEVDTNRRFVVKRKSSTESRGSVVHQDLHVSELSRSAVEYSIPVELAK